MSILVIDDEKILCDILNNVFSNEGYRTSIAHTAQKGLEKIKKEKPDIIFLDINLPDSKGLELLKNIKSIYKHLPVVMLTGYGTVDTAVKAMKLGAIDFITKPFKKEDILLVVQKALQSQSIKKEDLIGNSKQIKEVVSLTEKVAPTDLCVLIQGESGVGKGVIAQIIYSDSLRNDKPFVVVDCGTLPENLIESELFGYEKGAFTGADKRKKGNFEIANGGTVFLNEVSNLKYSAQAKLLRVLQEKEIQRIGGKKIIKIDVRIIADSNISLEEKIGKGEFREDLFHRLNEFNIYVPPLREREEDIFYLTEYFLKQANEEFSKIIQRLSYSVKEIFRRYTWPGNVRELKNVIRRAVLIADNIIYPEHLALSSNLVSCNKSVQPIKEMVKESNGELEKSVIINAFNRTDNKTKVAKMLGISRQALYYKMRKFGIEI